MLHLLHGSIGQHITTTGGGEGKDHSQGARGGGKQHHLERKKVGKQSHTKGWNYEHWSRVGVCSPVLLGTSMREAWKRQVWEATSWKKAWGLAGVLLLGERFRKKTVASWQVLRLEAGRLVNGKTAQKISKNIAQAGPVFWNTWAK